MCVCVLGRTKDELFSAIFLKENTNSTHHIHTHTHSHIQRQRQSWGRFDRKSPAIIVRLPPPFRPPKHPTTQNRPESPIRSHRTGVHVYTTHAHTHTYTRANTLAIATRYSRARAKPITTTTTTTRTRTVHTYTRESAGDPSKSAAHQLPPTASPLTPQFPRRSPNKSVPS